MRGMTDHFGKAPPPVDPAAEQMPLPEEDVAAPPAPTQSPDELIASIEQQLASLRAALAEFG